jgi:O-antigen/teichoic acid export membrane protein
MAWKLPIQVTTAFVTGVFLGLIITEGPLQIFNRLFSFYHAQTNLGEVKRILKRSYVLVGCILLTSLAFLFGIGYLEKIPTNLMLITAISACTVSLHRASYMIIYSQKKITGLITSYSLAFACLLTTYYLGDTLIPNTIERYFVGLILAFITLSIFAVREHYKITKISSTTDYKDKPHFYNPINKTDKTIKSKFKIQLWETLPYLLFGTFYFSTMFTDRILSWIYNPLIHSAHTGLPMIFNTVYHSGADMALVVLFPTSIIQYIMIVPIFMEINNISLVTKISEAKTLNKYITEKHTKLLLISILTSIITALILNFIIAIFDTDLSKPGLHILQIASISNVFLAIFTSNTLFLLLLNKAKQLAVISILCTIIVSSLGIILGQKGFENIVFAYLVSSIFGGLTSTVCILKIIKNSSSILFARFV